MCSIRPGLNAVFIKYVMFSKALHTPSFIFSSVKVGINFYPQVLEIYNKETVDGPQILKGGQFDPETNIVDTLMHFTFILLL